MTLLWAEHVYSQVNNLIKQNVWNELPVTLFWIALVYFQEYVVTDTEKLFVCFLLMITLTVTCEEKKIRDTIKTRVNIAFFFCISTHTK